MTKQTYMAISALIFQGAFVLVGGGFLIASAFVHALTPTLVLSLLAVFFFAMAFWMPNPVVDISSEQAALAVPAGVPKTTD